MPASIAITGMYGATPLQGCSHHLHLPAARRRLAEAGEVVARAAVARAVAGKRKIPRSGGILYYSAGEILSSIPGDSVAT